MNTIVFHKTAFGVLSLAAVAVLGGGMPAVAENLDTISTQQLTQISKTEEQANTQAVSNSAHETVSSIVIPTPGTVETSSAALAPQTSESTSQTAAPNVAQADIGIGTTTRGGSSYIGVAANIGLSGGDSALGDGNFMIISKIGFTRAFSVRPSAVLGDDTVFLIPVSYDFSFQQLGDPLSEALPIAPYVGAGAAIKTGGDSQVSLLLSGGVDVPLNSQFTANAAVNAAFFDETDIGLSIGVGYNFGGFGI
ncbi:hypothetical protein [Chlorogloeopsis sp. ULAP02]|uniref:hypothetical protein n=1 Tax=Chlorogloeopsis sp. ULAP02 TaxID=3107926 RepID=UPI003134B1D4